MDGTSNIKGTSSMFLNRPVSKHSFFLMFMTYFCNSIIFLSYSRGSFCAIVVLVRIHRPFLLISLSHHEVVPAKSVIDISLTSLLASIKIIFVETEITLICGNKMPTRRNRGFYCRSYCLLNMFRAPLCPSSGAQVYCTGLCVRFAGCYNSQLHTKHSLPVTYCAGTGVA